MSSFNPTAFYFPKKQTTPSPYSTTPPIPMAQSSAYRIEQIAHSAHRIDQMAHPRLHPSDEPIFPFLEDGQLMQQMLAQDEKNVAK